MAIQIGAKPDAGFDDPLGMLKDCHRRIENFLRVLCTVAERAGTGALRSEEADAVLAALHYFHVGGVRHNADEEESLFPRLRRELALASIDEISALESEHRTAGDLHDEVERLYRVWMANDGLREGEAERLRATTRRLQTIYEGHIEVEETVVFPRAAEVLDRETLKAMGAEFRARRQ
jgi:hemerythrin-like domain-containing protein